MSCYIGNHIIRSPYDQFSQDASKVQLSCRQYGLVRPGVLPILFLLGGPGEAAASVEKVEQSRQMVERLARSTAVFVLDQRGCGDSEPSWPSVPVPRHAEFFHDPEISELQLLAQASQQRQQLPTGFQASTISPLQSASDLPYVAAQLGVRQFAVLAYSYGTHLAMAAMKSCPQLLARAVLCGCEGPDQTFKLPSQFERQWERIESQTGHQCRQMATKTLERLPHKHALQWILSTWLGVRPRLEKVPALLRALESGDDEQLQRVQEGFLKMLDRRPPTFWLCDAASGLTSARKDRIKAEAEATVLGDAANSFVLQVGEEWGQVDLGDEFRLPVIAPCPTLVLTGSMDPFTPTENVAEAFASSENLVHHEIENATHTDLLTGEQVQAAVEDFLLSATAPTEKLSVPAIEWER